MPEVIITSLHGSSDGSIFLRLYFFVYSILFNKAYVFTDLFNGFFFSFIEDHFVFFEKIASFCIDGYDQWSKLFYAAVPQCLRHSEISPLSIYDLFYFCSCYYCVSCREYTMDRFVQDLSYEKTLSLTSPSFAIAPITK